MVMVRSMEKKSVMGGEDVLTPVHGNNLNQ